MKVGDKVLILNGEYKSCNGIITSFTDDLNTDDLNLVLVKIKSNRSFWFSKKSLIVLNKYKYFNLNVFKRLFGVKI